MRVTASELRQNLCGILDRVLETGIPVEVIRKGKILRIIPEVKSDKQSRLKKRPDYIVGDSEDFVHMDWLHEWSELK